MAKIFLATSLSPDEPQLPLDRMVDSARRSRRNGHVLTDGPDEADLILFVESWVTDQILTQVRRNPIYLIHRMKSMRERLCLSKHPIAAVQQNGGRVAETVAVRHNSFFVSAHDDELFGRPGALL